MKVPFPSRGNYYDQEDCDALLRLLSKDHEKDKLDTIQEFEYEFSKYIGVRYALSVVNATSALDMALEAIGIKEGDEVITTPLTWVATANVILLKNAKPVFVDVDPETLNIDPLKIGQSISPRTKAIIPVHLYGHPVDLDPIMEIAGKNNIKVISDAAHAPGAEYKGKKIGSIENLTAFSFYTQKNISTLGEGGMIVTDNPEYFKKMKRFRNFGVEYLHKNKKTMIKEKPWFRNCVSIGPNFKLSEGQAAVGITQLKKLNFFNKIRRDFFNQYNELLKGVKGITLPAEKKYALSACHLYSIKIEKKFGWSRDEVCLKLKKCGVGTNVHYTPLHYFLPFQKLGYKVGDFPLAEAAYEKIISLPLSPGMTMEQIEFVAKCLKKLKK